MLHHIPKPLRVIGICALIGFVIPMVYMFIGRLVYFALLSLDLGEGFSAVTTTFSMGGLLIFAIIAFLKEIDL